MITENSASSGVGNNHGAQRDIAPLPLIRCPRCNQGSTEWYISNTTKNPGRHFYRCQFQGVGGCSFFKWENAYIDYIRSRWGHIFAGEPPEDIRSMLLQFQSETKNNMFTVLAIFAMAIAALYIKF